MEINNEMLHSSSLLPDSIHVLLSNHVFRVLLILWVLGIVLRGLILILIKLIESDGQGNVDGEESADYNDQYKNTENYRMMRKTAANQQGCPSDVSIGFHLLQICRTFHSSSCDILSSGIPCIPGSFPV